MNTLPFPLALALVNYAAAQKAFGVARRTSTSKLPVTEAAMDFVAAMDALGRAVQAHRSAAPPWLGVLYDRGTLRVCEGCALLVPHDTPDPVDLPHVACAQRLRVRLDAVKRLLELGSDLASSSVELPTSFAVTKPMLRTHAGFRDAAQTGDGAARGWVVVYAAHEAEIDTAPDAPWVASCETHGTHLANTTLPLARAAMQAPSEWCEACRDAEAVARA